MKRNSAQKAEILQKLEDANMHVHVIDHEAGYHNYNYPIAFLVSSTHFVMHLDKIIHVGNPNTVERFALAL